MSIRCEKGTVQIKLPSGKIETIQTERQRTASDNWLYLMPAEILAHSGNHELLTETWKPLLEYDRLRPRKITPQDAMNAAIGNPLLDACIHMWRMGELSWDEAMTTAAVQLATQNQFLMNELGNQLMHRAVVPTGLVPPQKKVDGSVPQKKADGPGRMLEGFGAPLKHYNNGNATACGLIIKRNGNDGVSWTVHCEDVTCSKCLSVVTSGDWRKTPPPGVDDDVLIHPGEMKMDLVNHLEVAPGRVACGADVPNMRSTSVREKATCMKCLEASSAESQKVHIRRNGGALCGAVGSELEIRYAVEVGGATCNECITQVVSEPVKATSWRDLPSLLG